MHYNDILRALAAIHTQLEKVGDENLLAIRAVEALYESVGEAGNPIPRPVTPEGFRTELMPGGLGVILSWAFPLPEETPLVQVHRRPTYKPEGVGWENLGTTDGSEMFDVDIPVPPSGGFEYRIRGFGYKENAEPYAGPWSHVIDVGNPHHSEPVDPPTRNPQALTRADKTSEENKAWRAPAMLASRTGRALASPGDVRRGQWTQGDLIKLNMESVVTGQWHSNMHVDGDPRPGKYVWRNIECRSEIEDVWATKNLWGAREHYVPERIVEDCDFSFMKEHGLYISPQEGSTVRRSTFVNVGAQGLQYAHRPAAKGNAYKNNHSFSDDPVFVVDDCHMIDCGRFAGRGSFSLTYFTCGNVDHPGTFKVSNSSFVANWDQPNNDYYGDYHSTGAMVVTAGSWDDGSTWTGGCQTKLIELTNNLYDYTTPDRPILSLRSFKDLVIADCCFIIRDNHRNKPTLVVDSYVDDPTIRSKRITLRNVHASGCFGKVDGGASFNIHCPGEEVIIDARSGSVINRRAL